MQFKKTPIVQALIAAILFGASAPLAKMLLGEVQPLVLAALLYLGSGVGLFIYKMLLRGFSGKSQMGAKLRKQDLPWLLGSIFAGGVAAPALLMFGLKDTPASTASLLLNFEAVATALIADFAFKEAMGKSIWSAVGLITLASIVLSLHTTGRLGFSLSSIAILGACVLWGIDNNFTRNLSLRDPVDIVIIKGTAAGLFSLLLALLIGDKLPGLFTFLLSSLLGLFSYGLSIVFFISAMRGMGSARTSAWFASAPFIGAAISFLIFREPLDAQFVISLPVLVIGIVFLIGEKHSHMHTHEETEHEHMHSHDDGHHLHTHLVDDSRKMHSHFHKHEPMTHEHPHAPDIHHRHEHNQEHSEVNKLKEDP